MILAQTKATGYSLGLPLWWPGNDAQLSTGWVQGISLVLRGGPTDVYLTRYRRIGNELGLTFSTDDELLCSLTTAIGTRPTTYALQGESSRFVSGHITFYGDNEDVEELDLTGAQVCPKYITFITPFEPTPAVFRLANASGTVTQSVDLSTLSIGASPTVGARIIGTTGEFFIATSMLQPQQETTWVKTINGGAGVISLPAGWVVESTGRNSAKVGRLLHTSSCADYLAQKINPANYTVRCPLDEVLDDEGKFSFKNIVCKRYNTEYENGGAGLEWDEFSKLHDAPEED